jgi:hypothetical protein
MGCPTPLIRSVSTPAYGKVAIEASDGNRYETDLSSFSRVYCFPRSASDWERVSIDGYGLGLIWASRFEVHAEQIIALAERVEPVARTGLRSTTETRHA